MMRLPDQYSVRINEAFYKFIMISKESANISFSLKLHLISRVIGWEYRPLPIGT